MRLGGFVLLAVLLTAAIAWRSLDLSSQHGRLSVSPLYDDVAYMLSAVTWMDGWANQSLFGQVLVLLKQHAPFSTLVAAIGLTLFPGGYVGPYYVSSFLILLFLLGIVWLSWKRPVIVIVTCLIGAACVPSVWHMAAEARPDLPWGLALGIAIGGILQGRLLDRSAWALVVLGIGCGVAGSIKPTAFPASLVCVGSIFVLRLFVDCVQAGGVRSNRKQAMATLLPFGLAWLGTTAILIGPAVIETIGYILRVFITQRDLWSTGEGFWSGLAHFSVGAEGKTGLRFWLWIGLALMGIRLVLAAIQSRAALQNALVVVAAIFITYAIPSVAEIKTYFFGATFFGVFVVSMVLNFCTNDAIIEAWAGRLVMTPTSRRRLLTGFRVLPLAAMAVLFVVNMVTGQVGLATPLTAQQQEDIRVATDRVWALVRETKPDQSGMIFVGFSNAYPVTSATIHLYAKQAHMKVGVRSEYFHRTVDETEQALLQSNIIVITSSLPHTLLGPRAGDELIKRLDANKDVCQAAALDFADVRVRVYRRPC